MRVDGRDLAQTDFTQVALAVRVFNRDFVAASVFPTSGDVAPIFIIGKQNVEKQKQVDQLKITRGKAQETVESARRAKFRADGSLDKFCIDQAKVIKDMLRSAGSNPYNNYNKGDFTDRAQKMITAGDQKAHALNDTARDKLLAQLRASPKAKVAPLTYRLPVLKSLADTVTDLLAKTVVSAAIQSLKDDAQLSSWVHSGLGLHQARGIATCLFCDQPMAKDRLAALEAHFSTEYEDLQRKLGEQIGVIQAAIKTGTDLVIPNAAELYDESVLGPAAVAVRGILFDKNPSANWKVPWHQDLSIAVNQRAELRSFGPWSVKAGITHVQPPIEVLHQMCTIRLHLDACGPENGPLKVIPGSHHDGILTDAQIVSRIKRGPIQICTVPQDGAVLMRPLILHASSAAEVPGHRRVIHFEFCSAELPKTLQWADAV